MRRNKFAKLSENSELGCGWFGVSFFHLCRVTKLKTMPTTFLCLKRNSYGMAVRCLRCCSATRPFSSIWSEEARLVLGWLLLFDRKSRVKSDANAHADFGFSGRR
jgi:hypothetical protein